MPITKSAKKSLKVSRAKKVENDAKKIQISKALKKVDAKSVNETISLIDKAVKTHVINKNKAARMKSQLAKKFGTPARHASQQGVAGRPKQVKAKSENVKTAAKSKKEAKPVAKKTVAKKPTAKK